MKYKVGDKVKLVDGLLIQRARGWGMTEFKKWLGKAVTIDTAKDGFYTTLEIKSYFLTDDMIEGLVEEEMPLDKAGQITDFEYEGLAYTLPDGYIFKDENGNVINATKIVLEKKKKEYPKTYDECARIMRVELWNCLWGEDATEYEEQTEDLMDAFIRLKVCRDAYWKIAGEEMGLGKPWEPNDADYVTGRYCIFVHRGNIICSTPAEDCPFTFPTEEMRDAFKENFDPDIEFCKEFL